jgi:hypothetical protein
VGEPVEGTVHGNIARWLLHPEGLVMEVRYLRIDLSGRRVLGVAEVWDAAAEVVRVEVPFSVAKGLHAYLSETLPKVNRQRIEEDAKWQADRK